MRPVNLIPPEDRRGEAAPLRTGPAAYVLIGVAAIALLAVTMLVMTGNSVKDRQAELDSLEAREQAATATAAALTPYTQFAAMAETRKATVTSLAQSRFDWERVMRELALVLPEDISLISVSAATAPGGSVSAGGLGTSATGPSLSLSGCALGQKGVAAFAAALHDIDGVTRVGISSSELGDKTGGSGGEGSNADCPNEPSISKFEVVAVFDGVTPAAGASAPADAAPPAGTPATGSETAVPEQQEAKDSAAEQIDKGRRAANLAPGVSQ